MGAWPNSEMQRISSIVASLVLSCYAGAPSELFLARACRNAYCIDPCRISGFRNCSVVQVNASLFNGLQAVVASGSASGQLGSRDGLISFRGSHSLGNWLGDFLTAVVVQRDASGTPSNWSEVGCPRGRCMVAKNWYDILYGQLTMMAQIITALKRVCPPNGCDQVYITGHSLGGILAQYAAAEVLKGRGSYTQGVHLLTFGSPRAGNPEFAAWLTSELDSATRVVNFLDTIPNVPSQGWAVPCNDRGLKWQHVGCERWYWHPNTTGFPKIWPDGDPWEQQRGSDTKTCVKEDHINGQERFYPSCGSILKSPFPKSDVGDPIDHCAYLGNEMGTVWKEWICDPILHPSKCQAYGPL